MYILDFPLYRTDSEISVRLEPGGTGFEDGNAPGKKNVYRGNLVREIPPAEGLARLRMRGVAANEA
jgi:hypothetical protein